MTQSEHEPTPPNEAKVDATESIRYSTHTCPICGGGLCMVRVCAGHGSTPSHGLIVCDECEAIWMQPDMNSPHVYPDAESAACPICRGDLYRDTRFANESDLHDLGWADAIDPALTMEVDS